MLSHSEIPIFSGKLKILLTLLFAVISFNCFSQDLIFEWKHEIHNGERSNEGRTICTDTAGYVYVGGRLENTIQFIDTILNCVEDNAFLSKISPDGELVWIKWYRYCSLITAMCFDHENNLCVTGNYYRYLDLGDTILHTNHADTLYCSNQFIAKYDTDGNLLWAKSNTGVYISGYSNPIHNITIDNENNILITGRCIEELQYFDTNIVINTLDSALVTYPYPYWYYYYKSVGFLAKYSSSGDFLWVKELGGWFCEPAAIKTDNSDNIFVTGQFQDTAYFDTIMVESYGAKDIFLVKHTPNGETQWVETAGGSAGDEGFDIAVDSMNNIYLTGKICGHNVAFGDNIQFTLCYDYEAFVAKYDSLGNFLWVTPFGTSHFTEYPLPNDIPASLGSSICINGNNLFFIGYFKDTLEFNGIFLEKLSGFGLYLLKLDLDGNVIKAGQYLEDGWLYPQEIASDQYNNIYFTAMYQVSSNNYQIIIGKISDDIPINVILYSYKIENINIYPNPSNGNFRILFSNNVRTNYIIEIFNILGGRVFNKQIINNNKNIIIDVSYLEKGIYLLRITGNGFVKTKKIIIN